jgi:DNA modification methylase
LIIQDQSEYLKHLEHIKEKQGLLTDEADAPLGFNVNTKPFSQAHFAVFPKELITPCLLAGTSPKACGHCSAPYVRITKPTRETLGWQPTCNCTPPDPIGKCLVLDPFIGSGTTAIEALNNNRTYLGIDISKQYTTMAQTRIKQETRQSSLF